MKRSNPFSIVTDILFIAFLVIFPLATHFMVLVYAFIVLLLGWLYLTLQGEKIKYTGFNFSQLGWQPFAIGALIGVGYAFVQYWLLGRAQLAIPGQLWGISSSKLINYLFVLAVTWLVAIPYEEIVFRGFIFKRLQAMIKGSWRFGLSLFIMSLLYGLYHVQQGMYGVINAFVFSLACGALYKLFKGNLWYIIFFHAAYFTCMLL
jgi:membrane protease YdiL (CAAX protease family)